MLARIVLGLVIVCGVSGCAAPVPVTPITGPDGRTAYSMKCSGFGRDRQDCLVQAGKLCPAGYVVVDDSSSTGGAIVTDGAVILAKREYLSLSCK